MQKFLDVIAVITVTLLLIGSATLPLVVKYSFPAYFFLSAVVLFIFYVIASILTIKTK